MYDEEVEKILDEIKSSEYSTNERKALVKAEPLVRAEPDEVTKSTRKAMIKGVLSVGASCLVAELNLASPLLYVPALIGSACYMAFSYGYWRGGHDGN